MEPKPKKIPRPVFQWISQVNNMSPHPPFLPLDYVGGYYYRIFKHNSCSNTPPPLSLVSRGEEGKWSAPDILCCLKMDIMSPESQWHKDIKTCRDLLLLIVFLNYYFNFETFQLIVCACVYVSVWQNIKIQNHASFKNPCFFGSSNVGKLKLGNFTVVSILDRWFVWLKIFTRTRQ